MLKKNILISSNDILWHKRCCVRMASGRFLFSTSECKLYLWWWFFFTARQCFLSVQKPRRRWGYLLHASNHTRVDFSERVRDCRKYMNITVYTGTPVMSKPSVSMGRMELRFCVTSQYGRSTGLDIKQTNRHWSLLCCRWWQWIFSGSCLLPSLWWRLSKFGISSQVLHDLTLRIMRRIDPVQHWHSSSFLEL
jgi:hypothetical protein